MDGNTEHTNNSEAKQDELKLGEDATTNETLPEEAPQTEDSQTVSTDESDDSVSGKSRFTQIQAVLCRLWKRTKDIWGRRPKLSFALYFIVFSTISVCSMIGLQWSVQDTAADTGTDDTSRYLLSVAGQVTNFVGQIWIDRQYQALLNVLVIAMIYFAFILIINRFWISTAIFGSLMIVYVIANYFKVQARTEPIIPADLNFVLGGNTKELTSFIPKDAHSLVAQGVTLLIWLVVVCLILQLLDRRGPLIACRWTKPAAAVSYIGPLLARICAPIVVSITVFSFVWNLAVPGSCSYMFAQRLSDQPVMWNSILDARNNGTAMSFLRLAHTETMDKPEGYSKAAMQDLVKRYTEEATSINKTHTANLTENTVIMILSESFSDPMRMPGIELQEDPIPNIRAVKQETTSGLMLSPGYGGGTANIEYQALTGLNMANYSPSLNSAYQQLVPKQKWVPTFNQLWNDAGGGSEAFHSYIRAMYFRNENYKKFGFSKFWALDGKQKMSNLTTVDAGIYASDKSTYQNVIDRLNADDAAKNTFMQVVTMQNHTPYNNWYYDNQFTEADTSANLSDEEKASVDTYAKGAWYTDQYTVDFLNQLNQIDKPITVIFYGDHLPGIYSTASADQSNAISLHETDYFIWSNQASPANGTKLDAQDASYSSSNFFMSQTAEHLNAKVSPYLAFLTKLHEQVAAISTPAASGSKSDPTYLDSTGKQVSPDKLSLSAKQLLHDYQLVQYDLTTRNPYLKDSAFFKIKE